MKLNFYKKRIALSNTFQKDDLGKEVMTYITCSKQDSFELVSTAINVFSKEGSLWRWKSRENPENAQKIATLINNLVQNDYAAPIRETPILDTFVNVFNLGCSRVMKKHPFYDEYRAERHFRKLTYYFKIVENLGGKRSVLLIKGPIAMFGVKLLAADITSSPIKYNIITQEKDGILVSEAYTARELPSKPKKEKKVSKDTPLGSSKILEPVSSASEEPDWFALASSTSEQPERLESDWRAVDLEKLMPLLNSSDVDPELNILAASIVNPNWKFNMQQLMLQRLRSKYNASHEMERGQGKRSKEPAQKLGNMLEILEIVEESLRRQMSSH